MACRQRWSLLCAASAVPIVIAGASMAVAAHAASASASASAKDIFNGRIVNASARFSQDRGRVTVVLGAAHSAAATRHLRLVLESPACARQRHCLRLSGALSGTITAQTSIPDVGRHYELQAGGRITPLGRVSATGEATGVGFIMHGRERLELSIHAKRGQLTIRAQSPLVPGFTSP